MRRLLLLCALLPAPALSQTRVPRAAPVSMCGIEGTTIANLQAKVAADPRYKRDGGDALHEVWSAEAIESIWTFNTARNAIHPAALCEQVSEKNGAMQIERHQICEAAAAACAKFAAEIQAREEGSGDNE